jgi:hypothetical protein
MTPTKEEIERRAREIYAKDSYRNGVPELADTNPEIGELRENGCWSQSVSELMRDESKAESAEWKNYNENLENSSDLKFDVKEGMATTTFISGSRGIGKSDVAMKIADQLMKEGILVVAFDPSTDWVKRSGITEYLKAEPFSDLAIPEHSMIVDTSMLTPMRQQQTVEWFCKKLFEYQLHSVKRFYLIFEEAQIFFPLNSLRSLKTQNTMRILTTGRNFNVSLCAISQFAATIDKELVKHAGQIFLGYASEQNTLSYWRGILGKKAEDLKTLQNGEFVYFNRNKIGKIQIEPFENNTVKIQIQIPEPHSIEPTQPIRTNQSTTIALARLGIIALFTILLLGAIK